MNHSVPIRDYFSLAHNSYPYNSSPVKPDNFLLTEGKGSGNSDSIKINKIKKSKKNEKR